MSYIATIHNKTHRVDIGDESHQSVTLDETTHALDWQQVAPLAADSKGVINEGGRFTLLIEGRSYEVLGRRITKPDQKGSETYEIQVVGRRFEVTVEDERTKLLTGLARSNGASGVATVQAPMPGLVVGIPLALGATVEAGQTVVVLEAMKMENDLAAPIAGTIKEIRVSKGQTVDQGEALVVVSSSE